MIIIDTTYFKIDLTISISFDISTDTTTNTPHRDTTASTSQNRLHLSTNNVSVQLKRLKNTNDIPTHELIDGINVSPKQYNDNPNDQIHNDKNNNNKANTSKTNHNKKINGGKNDKKINSKVKNQLKTEN